MKKLSSMLKECSIEAVLKELAAGVPPGKRAVMLKRYYSVYCMMLEEWRPAGKHEMILMSFRKPKHRQSEDLYSFYGVRDYREIVIREEDDIDPVSAFESGKARIRAVNWAKIIRPESEVEVLVPECLAEAVGDTALVTLILYRFEKVCGKDIPERSNKKMFAAVCETTPLLPGRMTALEKTVRHKICHGVRSEYLIDEIREYGELTGLTMQWESLLAMTGSYIDRRWSGDPWDRSVQSEMILAGEVGRNMVELDPDNPPSAERVREKIQALQVEFSNLGLSEFQEVQQKRARIVIIPNPFVRTLPFIRVRRCDGTERPVQDVDVSELMCMEIHVMDKTCFSEQRVLALLLFNLLYPIRMKRMQTQRVFL